jgi:hypothetical protein
MLLGHRHYPRLPRGNFFRVLRDAGRGNAEETFDVVQHINRLQLYKFIQLAESAAEPLRRQLQQLGLRQLEAMSYNYGTREV